METEESCMRISNPWENLPQELITEVLLRLPVKSLLKFRCVSKSWFSLISGRQFKNTHLKISSSRRRLVFGSSIPLHACSLGPKFDEDPAVDDVPLDYVTDDPHYSYQIVGSCNGLVCLAIFGTGSIIVWNPATRKYKPLPVSFDDDDFCPTYGFGCDASNDDYKVVEFWEDPSRCRIYSLRNDSWRVSNWSHGQVYYDPGVFLNGALHWKVGDMSNYDAGYWDVVALNLTTENSSSVSIPVRPNEYRSQSVWLGVLGDCLCMSFDRLFFMEVWVMKEYGVKESWTKVVSFFNFFYYTKDLGSSTGQPLCVLEDGGVLMNIDSKLILCRPFEYRVILQFRDFDVEFTTYVESLVSPDMYGPKWMRLKDRRRSKFF